jgi:hypothetical protein
MDRHKQDWAVGVAHNPVGHVSRQQALQFPLVMRGEHDHVHILLLGHADDRRRRW